MVELNAKQYTDVLCIATYNIRVKTTADTAFRAWDNRKEQVAKLINKYNFDVFGVQEIANTEQENELKTSLRAYHSFVKGRDNTAGTQGEKIALFYQKSRFEALDSGYFFLSETPDIVSKGWDASYNRMCVWLKLRDKKTNQIAWFFNVHFDHMGVVARVESAKLLVRKMAEITNGGTAFCIGDFNASPLDADFYTVMTQKLSDSKNIALKNHSTTVGTFNGWDVQTANFSEQLRIDYIFSNCKKIEKYQVITDKYVPETYPSDHYPVMIKVLVK